MIILTRSTYKNKEQYYEKVIQKSYQDEQDKNKNILYCVLCKEVITTEDHRISINESHEHNFANPHGHTYAIGCFQNADGCINQGSPTYEWTWFKGYMWEISLCKNCNLHLGWHFQSENNNSFYGLILTKLISNTC